MSDPGPIVNLTPERWQHLKEIFQFIAECERPERTRLLDQACADDPELRQQLELLLESDEEAKSFLENSPQNFAPMDLRRQSIWRPCSSRCGS